MIFFDYYFKAYSTPKYLEPVAVCMERRYKALMADEPTLKKFVAELKSELNSIPKAEEDINSKLIKAVSISVLLTNSQKALYVFNIKRCFLWKRFSENLCKSLDEVAEKGGEK